jgi:hypothetical protein
LVLKVDQEFRIARAFVYASVALVAAPVILIAVTSFMPVNLDGTRPAGANPALFIGCLVFVAMAQAGFAAVLLLFRLSVTPDGVRLGSAWEAREVVPWDNIRDVFTLGPYVARILLLHPAGSSPGGRVFFPTALEKRAEFRTRIMELAPEDNPLRRYVSGWRA